MQQFTLYKNENKNSKKAYPYFIDVQNDLLSDLNSRIVIPLSAQEALNNLNAKKLCPSIEIDECIFVLLTHQMTSVPCSALKNKVTSLEHYRYDILAAIDLLLTGI
ncbi:MAG: plasmid maintenance protein CcdB [Methylococcales symbiont of Hymedesmia sp. n. MRB-2018]|nr:MAG: plasmid maintenance protein CcdB [Methylococcales symbiont of Hymedesmia sp. n. MRB-2018]